MKKIVKLVGVALLLGMFSGCGVLDSLDDPTPTETLMEGVWEVTAVYDMGASDPAVNMLDSIGLGYNTRKVPQYMKLSEDGYIQTTAGPLFLYLVYGNKNWTNFFGKLDDVFKYADLEFTNGNWAIDNGVVSDFDIRITLMPPSMKTFTSILELFGVNTQQIKSYLLHEFLNVDVTVKGSNRMEWEWTNDVLATYFTSGDNFTEEKWLGFEASKYTRCKIVFEKRAGTLQDLVQAN